MRLGNQSLTGGNGGVVDRKAALFHISFGRDALFLLQVNISLLCRTKLGGR